MGEEMGKFGGRLNGRLQFECAVAEDGAITWVYHVRVVVQADPLTVEEWREFAEEIAPEIQKGVDERKKIEQSMRGSLSSIRRDN